MSKMFEIHLLRNSFLQFTIEGILLLGYVWDCLQCTTLKMFDISSSNLPCRNSMFILLMFNKGKIISYLYIFILIYAYIVHHTLILMQYMQIIQKKGNMKIYVIINIYEKVNRCDN